MPRGFEWPRRNGLPLAFLGMIRLSELPPTGGDALPPRGLLYFWYDAFGDKPWGIDLADRDGWRVDFVSDENIELESMRFPAVDLPKSYRNMMPSREGHFDRCSLTFSAGLSLPSVAWLREYRDDLQWVVDVEEQYYSLHEASTGDHQPQHVLLGYANPVQNPMEVECQITTTGPYRADSTGNNDPRARAIKAGALDWRLLFQIDTDETGPGWMWGDVGMLYFWIRKRDLAAHDFSNVWMVLQCC